ncbi:MAG: DUF6125 family protein [Candidatus Methanomethylicia archaeon]|nr:DUF6125 family protein [Candidatus Methanomethylicia archaeon]MCQ5374328.1 DUF6125 family protein [Candidatus Methanomethylicia archaeon]
MDLVEVMSKNLLTLDGYWFLSIENRYGQSVAVEIDREAWEQFGVSEARRIKKFLKISDGTLEDLARALHFTSIAPVSAVSVETRGDRVVLNIRNCRPQTARLRSGRGLFPCKPVGLAHLSAFAKVINPRFKVRCLLCPPDEHPDDLWCSWEFRLE